MSDFRGYSEISNFNPQTRYFHKNVYFRIFKKGHFWGYEVENWVLSKSALWIWSIFRIRVKMVNTQLFSTFFHKNRPYRPIYRKIKKNHFSKKNTFFFDRKLALEEPKWVRWENHVSPESALTFPTNP